jgi:sugar/nucleoside kinase (ribokinase family)
VNDHSMIDYLVVGHVTHDLTPNGPVAGGTVTYSSRVAQALGCRTAVVTSAARDLDLDQIFPGMEVIRVPAAKTTTFENVYSDRGRKQFIHSVAEKITVEHIPEDWRRAKIVHLGPISNELDPDLVSIFSNSLVGITPQGWYRRWKDDGQVYIGDWPEAEEVLKLAGAVIVSPEDLPSKKTIKHIRKWCQLVVLTLQSSGSRVYFRNESRPIAALDANEVNPTGAGDIFTTAFLIRLYQTRGNPWEAAEFANRIAAISVSHQGLVEKIEAIKKNIG